MEGQIKRKRLDIVDFLRGFSIFTIVLYFGLVCGQDVLMPLLGSVFLFKMFVPSLECAFGGQMWFVSTIIQFYLFYPLIVKMLEKKKGISLLISLCWATFTALTGLAEERIWNSFFLQYLWEFVLGMWLAKVYFENSENIKVPKVSVLLVTMIIGLGLTGIAGFVGGIWKSYNDIPSLIGYMSMALIFYQVGVKWLNKFFEYTNKISYEWYLVHILVFTIYFRFARGVLPFFVDWVILMFISYLVAIGYQILVNRFIKI